MIVKRWEELTPRERDVLVEEKVRGNPCRLVWWAEPKFPEMDPMAVEYYSLDEPMEEDACYTFRQDWVTGDGEDIRLVPRYTASMDQAWTLVESFSGQFTCWNCPPDGYFAEVRRFCPECKEVHVATTAPYQGLTGAEAICLVMFRMNHLVK